jgi:hypothetical protein
MPRVTLPLVPKVPMATPTPSPTLRPSPSPIPTPTPMPRASRRPDQGGETGNESLPGAP